jgi:hypothetical protein
MESSANWYSRVIKSASVMAETVGRGASVRGRSRAWAARAEGSASATTRAARGERESAIGLLRTVVGGKRGLPVRLCNLNVSASSYV